MVLFRDLIHTIAEAEAISEVAVTGIGQYLRDAGLISKHGRGKAAAQMTVQDAVHLLIAVNATDLAKNAAQTAEEYLKLSIAPMPKNQRSDAVSAFVTTEGHNLGEALSFILRALMPVDGQRSDFDKMLEETNTTIEVGFGRPIASAYIKICWNGPRNPGDPFSGSDRFEELAFAHYWGNSGLWSQHQGQRELRIIDHTVFRAVASNLA
ncbi:hypothetical protein [Methylobacterium sp. NEAU K]|uniref:hypothetical protein n=1 Tax=Methylobacterium sp. NEAU K TaxID=3064946 RepID=UPI002733A47D|nr:hypothetical protein [Methylobacterium sp. NEAU K]MDP4006399.1 hypothetical protein [Methylobacterium sp. NEAU K]